jgi:succinate dehydrogenase / fumarate reductase iron-sulfur subunit
VKRKDTITVRIRKLDPSTGKGCLDEYEVPFESGHNVLSIINHIYEEMDPGLGFRQSCHATFCGTCRVRVNGRDALACKVLVKDRETLLIEPTALHPVMRDLIVDFDRKNS